MSRVRSNSPIKAVAIPTSSTCSFTFPRPVRPCIIMNHTGSDGVLFQVHRTSRSPAMGIMLDNGEWAEISCDGQISLVVINGYKVGGITNDNWNKASVVGWDS